MNLNRYITLGTDLATGRPVTLGDAERMQHTLIQGVTGSGKTTELLNIAVQDMERGMGMAVLDTNGGLIEELLKRVPPERMGDVVLLDAGETQHPFALSLYDCINPQDPNAVSITATNAVDVFYKNWKDSWGAQMAEVLRVCAYTCAEAGLTMAEIPLLLINLPYRDYVLSKVTNLYVHIWWQMYNQWNERLKEERINSTRNKLSEFLMNPVLLHITAQPKSSINMREAMDNGQIVFIKLPIGIITEPVANLLGSLFISQILTAGFSREGALPEQWYQFNVICDEFQRVANDDFKTALTGIRQYNVNFTFAFQTFADLSEPLREAAMQAGNMVIYRVTPQDAERYAPLFRTEPVPGERSLEMITDPRTYSYTERNWKQPLAQDRYDEIRQRMILIKPLTPYSPKYQAEYEQLEHDRDNLANVFSKLEEQVEYTGIEEPRQEVIVSPNPDGFGPPLEHYYNLYRWKEGPPRLRSDVQAETAELLANQDNWRAWYKLLVDEVRRTEGQLIPPPKPEETLNEQQVTLIRLHCRMQYTKSVAAIREEMLARHTEWMRSPAPAAPATVAEMAQEASTARHQPPPIRQRKPVEPKS